MLESNNNECSRDSDESEEVDFIDISVTNEDESEGLEAKRAPRTLFTIDNILRESPKVGDEVSCGKRSWEVRSSMVVPGLVYGNWVEMQTKSADHQLVYGLHHGLPSKSNMSKRLRKPGIDRKPRQAYSAKQLERLESEFKQDKYLSVSKRMELSKLLNLTEVQIKTWFQNRRTKWKKQLTSRLKIAQRQGFYGGHFSSYYPLFSAYSYSPYQRDHALS